VRILMASWAMNEIPFDTAARSFNEANPGTQIIMESMGEGWDTKVMAQIAAGKLEWNAAGIASSASSSLPRWVLSGMVQPMDDYVAVSKQEGANILFSDMLPTLRKASQHDGKFWGLPYSYENISFNWRTDFFKAVGATEAPATWADWLPLMQELAKWGKEQKIIATSFIPDLDASVGAMIYSSLDNPFGDDELLRWETPEALAALKLYKQAVDEGLTPPHGFDNWLDAYYAGKLASVQAQSSRGVWGQLAFGTDKVVTSQIPVLTKGKGAGTAFWGNCTALLSKAPYPQETMDYLIYVIGPQNTALQQAIIKTGKTPVYQSAYDKIINGDPAYGTFKWMNDMRDQVDRSVSRPFNNYFSINDGVYAKYIVQFTEPGSTMSAEEVAANIVKDTKAEIAKQKK
jgi:ABC-type glycerol-3-phosphate transport system substrate-binding protein